MSNGKGTGGQGPGAGVTKEDTVCLGFVKLRRLFSRSKKVNFP